MSLFAGRFSGRTAIITGGASGLGFLTAKRILEEGGRVSLWDVNPSTLGDVRKELGDVHTVAVNVGSHGEVAEAARQSKAALGEGEGRKRRQGGAGGQQGEGLFH